MCTGYFKVHISEEVFQSLDIGKNKIVIVCISSYKTCGNTGYCSFDRYSGCHKRHTGCAYACLWSRAVWFKCFRYCTDGIWKFGFAWKYREKSSFCQRTMSDLTSSRSSWRFCFTYRIWREIIMVHISLSRFWFIKTVKSLCFRQRRQCRYRTNLGLSSCKHCRTMDSWKKIHFCCKRSDLIDSASVRTFVIF